MLIELEIEFNHLPFLSFKKRYFVRGYSRLSWANPKTVLASFLFSLTNYFILLFPVCRSPISVAAAVIFLDHLQIVVKNQWQRHPIENSSNMQCWLLAIWFALKVSDRGKPFEISTASLATSNTTYWLWYDCDYLTWLRLCFLCRNRWHRRRSRRYNSSIVQMCSRTFSDWLPVYYSRGKTSEPFIFFLHLSFVFDV